MTRGQSKADDAASLAPVWMNCVNCSFALY
jgi:hypothetical protein